MSFRLPVALSLAWAIALPASATASVMAIGAGAFGAGATLTTFTGVADGTGVLTLALFDGTTAVGSLSFDGTPDPTFTGGFAGLLSTAPFDRVELTFDTSAVPAFAIDDIRTATVPEPALLVLFGVGLSAVALHRRRARRR
jgi:hypothetical protein